MITRTWKVNGFEGRQRASFAPSAKYDWSSNGKTRIVEVLNSDKTGTNDYSIIRITRDTADECFLELDGQLSDGIFENCRVGAVTEITDKINDLAEELLDFTEETFCEWTDEAKKRGYEHIESYLNDYAHGLNESREWGLNEAETDTVVEVAIQKYEKERCYYWLDTDYHYGDYNVKKWAMIRGRYTEDGEKDRDTEEVIAWGPIPDTDDMDEAWRLTDEAITESLGFLPDYEVN